MKSDKPRKDKRMGKFTDRVIGALALGALATVGGAPFAPKAGASQDAPPPIFTVSPTQTAAAGDPASLYWQADGAKGCTITYSTGRYDDLPPQGNKTITPMVTTTYMLTCSRSGGGDLPKAYVTLTVPPPVHIADFTGDPATLVRGQTSVLKIGADNAAKCEVRIAASAQPWQPMTPSHDCPQNYCANLSVTPLADRKYAAQCTGPGMKDSAETTVHVVGPPAISGFDATPQKIRGGETTTLTWSAQNAQSCVLDPGRYSVTANGSARPTLNSSQTFTLTCLGWDGSVTDPAAVGVNVTP